MKLMGLFFGTIYAFSSQASTVKCSVNVTEKKSAGIFLDYHDGEFTVDLETGDASVTKTLADGSIMIKSLASADTVSSFLAKRSTCELEKIVEKNEDGSIKAFRIVFDGCEVKNPKVPLYTAYVSSFSAFNFTTQRGLYLELFSDGATLTPGFYLENCKVQ